MAFHTLSVGIMNINNCRLDKWVRVLVLNDHIRYFGVITNSQLFLVVLVGVVQTGHSSFQQFML